MVNRSNYPRHVAVIMDGNGDGLRKGDCTGYRAIGREWPRLGK